MGELPDDPSSLSARLRPLGFFRYKDYLRSDHWREVRDRYRASDLSQACRCGAEKVALHHKTYVRLGQEELTDLEPLCSRCHRAEHGRLPRKAKSSRRAVRVRRDPTLVGKPFHAPAVPRDTMVGPGL